MRNFAEENKTLFTIITICLFLLELEIFAVAAMKSGNKSRIEVISTSGDVIYESSASNLNEFDKYYFEQNFGPLENYRTRLVKKHKPFPFRAWFVAALGIPVGFIMLLGFSLKAYVVFFRKEDSGSGSEKTKKKADSEASGFEKLIDKVSGLNVFVMGFFIVAALFLYWVLPNMVVYLSRVSLDTIIQYKWFFITAAGVFTCLVIWFIYLKYLLAKKAIESKTEIEIMRLQIAGESDGVKALPMQEEAVLIEDKNETNLKQ